MTKISHRFRAVGSQISDGSRLVSMPGTEHFFSKAIYRPESDEDWCEVGIYNMNRRHLPAQTRQWTLDYFIGRRSFTSCSIFIDVGFQGLRSSFVGLVISGEFHENLQESTKRFKTARYVVETHFGGPIQVPKIIRKVENYDPAKEDIYCRMTFEMDNADCSHKKV